MRRKNLRTIAQVQDHYDRNVEFYDVNRFGTGGGRYVDGLEQEFVERIIKGSRVLEVGTATGRFANLLTKKGADYTGVDLSIHMLRTTVSRTNHSASVIQMDGCNLGFVNHFDYVLCFRTFHFLPRPIHALGGMLQSLKPSGKCLITFETDNWFRRLILALRIGTSQQFYYKSSDVEEMFRQAGFAVLKSGIVMRLPVTFYRKSPRSLLWILKRLDRLWPWPMHEFVLGRR